MPYTEVVIVGGSVAGAATAVHLARAGRSVLLLEQHEAFRRKACGEGLFPRGVRELASLGLLDAVRGDAHLLAGVRFHAGGAQVAARFHAGSTGLGIRREDLDPRLLDLARSSGVDVRTGVRVQRLTERDGRYAGVRTDHCDFTAAVIVAADGIGSRLREEAGLSRTRRSRRYGISAHLRLPHRSDDYVDVHFGDGAEVYATPVAPDTVNVAILLDRARLDRMDGHLVARYWELLAAHPHVFEGARLLDPPVAAGPFGAAAVRPWDRNLVLVGDAGGFYDPIEGEGIAAALVSARHCAAAVDAHLRTGSDGPFRRYAGVRRALVRNPDLLARVTLAFAKRPALARRAVRNLARHPDVFARLLAVSTGDLPLVALRPRDAGALLLG